MPRWGLSRHDEPCRTLRRMKKALFIGIGVLLVALLALLWPRGSEPTQDDVAGAQPAEEESAAPARVDDERLTPASVEATRVDADEARQRRKASRTSWTRLHGKIEQLGEDGRSRRPVADLELALFGGDETVLRTRTDEAGRYEFMTRPGPKQLGASPSDGPAWWDALDVPAEDEFVHDRLLVGTTKRCVRVWRRDGDELAPLYGATVSLVEGAVDLAWWSSPLRSRATTSTTDMQGMAEVIAPLGGQSVPCTLEVRADGFMPFVGTLEGSSAGEDSSCVHVTLWSEGPMLEGVVLDPEGLAVPGAAVFLLVEHSTGDGVWMNEGEMLRPQQLPMTQPPVTWTDERGGFSVAGPGAEIVDIQSARVVVFPRRNNLVHHWAVELSDPRSQPDGVVVRIPRARPVRLVFLDVHGRPRAGAASLRDAFGSPYAPADAPLRWIHASDSARVFRAPEGGVELLLPSGPVVVGISPYDANGVPQWQRDEIGVDVPEGSDEIELRVGVGY